MAHERERWGGGESRRRRGDKEGTERKKEKRNIPGWVAQLVRASSQYAKVVGLIPGQDTYKNQPTNA